MSVEYYDPTDDECPTCGGEGFIFYCFDGFCADSEIGCDDCTQPCPDCGIRYKPSPKAPGEDRTLGDVLAEALAQQGTGR